MNNNDTLLKINLDSLNIKSFKSKEFDSSVFDEFFKTSDTEIKDKNYFLKNSDLTYSLVEEPKESELVNYYENKHARAGLGKVLDNSSIINPKDRVLQTNLPIIDLLKSNSISVDDLCEKPAYIPNTTKQAIIFPLGSKIEGCDLQDYFFEKYMKAKGTCPAENAPIYYYLDNGVMKKIKYQPSSGTDVSNYFIESKKLALDEAHNKIRSSYSPSKFDTFSYSRKVNFSYEGINPGTNKDYNLLKYNSDDNNWIKYWHNYDSISMSNNVFNTKDGLIIQVNNNTNFEYPVSLEEGKTYTFSCFLRVYDTEMLTSAIEDVDCRKTINNQNELKVMLNDDITRVYSFDTDWSYHYTTFTAKNNNFIKLSFLTKEDSLPVKICGLSLTETNYPIVYDYRNQYYEKSFDGETITYPLDILFLKDNPESSLIPENSSFTINYKRLIRANLNFTKNDYLCIDSLGKNIHFGYRNNKAILEVEGKDPVVIFDIETLSENEKKEFYKTMLNGRLENVFLTYDAENKKLHYKVYLSNEYNYETEIQLSSVELFDTIPLTTVKFNLLLGSFIVDNSLIITSGTYRDLMIFSEVLSNEEINKMNDTYMSISEGKAYREYYDDSLLSDTVVVKTKYDLKDNLTAIRASYIKETNNYRN